AAPPRRPAAGPPLPPRPQDPALLAAGPLRALHPAELQLRAVAVPAARDRERPRCRGLGRAVAAAGSEARGDVRDVRAPAAGRSADRATGGGRSGTGENPAARRPAGPTRPP